MKLRIQTDPEVVGVSPRLHRIEADVDTLRFLSTLLDHAINDGLGEGNVTDENGKLLVDFRFVRTSDA
jgi:hypothetical protein